MSDESSSVSSLYKAAGNKRQKLDTYSSPSSRDYQDMLASSLSDYRKAQESIQSHALFSSNETLDDIATSDLQYLSCEYYIADLTVRRTGSIRSTDLLESRDLFATFLKRLDNYDILTKEDVQLLERYLDSPDNFSTTSISDPTARREKKIQRFKAEKELKQKLAHLQSIPESSRDEETSRKLYLQQMQLHTHQAFQNLESIAQELHILSLAPPVQPPDLATLRMDDRDRRKTNDGYSDKLDGPITQGSAGLKGPLLDGKGRPLRPFTLLDKRQQLRDGVFRPDHNLPTMSIDEYLEEEKRRGGIIEGGGPQSGMQPEVDEDDLVKADEETMKARQWDDFTEENPRGAGNTLNRG